MSLTDTQPGKAVASEASSYNTKERRTAWILTAPALILMVIILLAPIAIAGLLSFTVCHASRLLPSNKTIASLGGW